MEFTWPDRVTGPHNVHCSDHRHRTGIIAKFDWGNDGHTHTPCKVRRMGDLNSMVMRIITRRDT